MAHRPGRGTKGMLGVKNQVCILGGGVTGMQIALALSSLGTPSVLVEKSASLGGRVSTLSRTFPLLNGEGFQDGKEFTGALEAELRAASLVDIRCATELRALHGQFPAFTVRLSDGTSIPAGAVVVATGFSPFDPVGLPAYGYGVYPNVISATELEWMLNPRGPTGGRLLRPSDGKPVHHLAIVFCVGSRNKRIGAPFCSRICCSYSTKQASLVMERDPKALVTCFYMDVRTYDRGFEEMYSLAKESGVRYIRGLVAMCRQLPDGSIAVRAENTLLNRPFTGEFDLVSLSTGMRPCHDVNQLSACLGISRGPDGFFLCRDWVRYPHDATRDGIFLAGCATGAKPIRDCIIDAAAVASRVTTLLTKNRDHGLSPHLPLFPQTRYVASGS